MYAMKLEPANTIIKYLDGARSVAKILGKHPSRIYLWALPRHKKGCGGIIPARDQHALLNYCRHNQIDLRADDFFSPKRLQHLMSGSQNEMEKAS